MADSTKEKEKETERTRLQLDFSSEAYRRLQDIRKLSDASSNAEVVRKALQVYEWMLKKTRVEKAQIHLHPGSWLLLRRRHATRLGLPEHDAGRRRLAGRERA